MLGNTVFGLNPATQPLSSSRATFFVASALPLADTLIALFVLVPPVTSMLIPVDTCSGLSPEYSIRASYIL